MTQRVKLFTQTHGHDRAAHRSVLVPIHECEASC